MIEDMLMDPSQGQPNEQDQFHQDVDPRLKILLALSQAQQGGGLGPQGQAPGMGPLAPPMAQDQSAASQAPVTPPPPPGPSERVADFINRTSPISQKALGTEAIDDKMNSLLQNGLLGFITRASNFGETPPPETFDKYFRRTTSPGRELLANVLYGASAGLTGEKFRTVRAQKFEEYSQEQERIQKAQYQDQVLQNNRATLLANLLKAREINQTKLTVEAAKDQNADEKRLDQVSQFAQKYNIDVRKADEMMKNSEAKRRENLTKGLDQNMTYGVDAAEAEFQQKGLDPWAKENKAAFYQRAEEIARDYDDKKQAIYQLHHPQRPAQPRYIPPTPIKVTTAYGDEYGFVDKQTGDIMGPSHWRKNISEGAPTYSLTPAQKDRAEKFDQVRGQLQTALNSFIATPNDLGSILNALPAELRPNITKGQRANELMLNAAKNAILYANSGAQINEKEMGRITAGMPKLFESPEKVVPATMMLLNMLDAGQLRLKAGIDASKLDLDGVYSDMENIAVEKMKKGEKFKILTGDQIIEQAMKRKGYKPIRDKDMNIRGMERE